MAIYHVANNSTLELLGQETFGSLNLMERSDLQRLLRQRVDVVAEGCFVLAEEFGDWDDSRRRIDLLAIDRDANLVVIELKRSEDGGHLDLQALRYAAMISTMSFEQAVAAHAAYREKYKMEGDARQAVLDFLGIIDPSEKLFGDDVRIVLVSADFSKEITTTVMWLNERELDIRCVRIRPYRFNDQVLFDVQQVIPLPEAEEYQVRVREKNERRRESRHAGPREYARFVITVGGRPLGTFNKRQAVLQIVKELSARGVSPEQMSKLAPERGDRFFISTSGTVASAAFCEQLARERRQSGRSFDPSRWFCDDDELLHVDSKTYAVSNQWGVGTEEVLVRLTTAFPQAQVEIRRDATD